MRCKACDEDVRTVLVMAHELGMSPRGVSFYIELDDGSVCIDDSEESRASWPCDWRGMEEVAQLKVDTFSSVGCPDCDAALLFGLNPAVVLARASRRKHASSL